MTFTADNTEGFTDDALDTLNEALETLKRRFPAAEEYTLCDMLNNAWVDRITADRLIEEASANLK